MWMRKPNIRRGRECVIPDVPRAYHFGASGLNMNSFFQDTYFRKRALNNLPDIQLHAIDRWNSIQQLTRVDKDDIDGLIWHQSNLKYIFLVWRRPITRKSLKRPWPTPLCSTTWFHRAKNLSFPTSRLVSMTQYVNKYWRDNQIKIFRF